MSRGSRPSLRRLWRYHPFLVVAIALLVATAGVGAVGGTLAVFSAQTQNDTSTFAAGWIGPATNFTVAPSGYDAQLLWTPGTHGPVTGQQLWGYDSGSSSSCSSASYAQLATLASATTSSYTDSHATSSLNGHYYCYEVLSTSSSGWTGTGAPSPAATQLGLVATSVSITNATSGQLAANDTIVVTYNQQPAISQTGLSRRICESWDATGNVTLYLVYSACAAQPTSPGYELEVTGLANGQTSAGSVNAALSAVSVRTTSPWTVTYKLSAALSQAMTPGAGTAVPDGSGTYVQSAATTDQADACTSATYHCTPTAVLG